ncbi:unnamed protein product [Cladocopium goreaui]|uniref:SET domain-containing protein n=1 Tax=Cladocopium goreaui TaxID=2562237 RepID=A0A9P1CVL5_9DINO|nr:unnamed protein product [Cladocopium goreaui]
MAAACLCSREPCNRPPSTMEQEPMCSTTMRQRIAMHFNLFIRTSKANGSCAAKKLWSSTSPRCLRICKQQRLNFDSRVSPSKTENFLATASCSSDSQRSQRSERKRLGKALVATRPLAAGDVVLVDKPFLVVSNPDSLERWVNRWDCYFEMMKLAQGGKPELLEAFEAMDDGGPEVVASLSTAALDTLQLMWRSAGSQALLVPEAKKEKDKLKVAGGFARWQTNQHEFPALAARPRRAMYWLAPKVAHSCDPNVGWEDPAEDGMVELRALRDIAPQEVLGVNYMDADFLLLSRKVRQERLLAERKFHCVCDRCLEKSLDEIPVVVDPAIPSASPSPRDFKCGSSATFLPFLRSLQDHLRAGKIEACLAALKILQLDASSGDDLIQLAEALGRELQGDASSDAFNSLD